MCGGQGSGPSLWGPSLLTVSRRRSSEVGKEGVWWWIWFSLPGWAGAGPEGRGAEELATSSAGHGGGLGGAGWAISGSMRRIAVLLRRVGSLVVVVVGGLVDDGGRGCAVG
jgi:hypothetical protein